MNPCAELQPLSPGGVDILAYAYTDLFELYPLSSTVMVIQSMLGGTGESFQDRQRVKEISK